MDFQKNNRVKILIIGISSLAITLFLVIPNVTFGIPQLGESDIGASQIINESARCWKKCKYLFRVQCE